VVFDADAAQARVLAGALQQQVQEMSARLGYEERRLGSVPPRCNPVMRRHAEDLWRDISKAKFLIERLHRRFPDIVMRIGA
jgi:hypothetical protein